MVVYTTYGKRIPSRRANLFSGPSEFTGHKLDICASFKHGVSNSVEYYVSHAKVLQTNCVLCAQALSDSFPPPNEVSRKLKHCTVCKPSGVRSAT